MILGVLAWVLRGRFEAIQSEARSVQLRMAVEAARSNALLLQIRCADWQDLACLRRAVAQAQRLPLNGQGGAPSAQSLPAPDAPRARLLAVAAMVGLTAQDASPWLWRWLGPAQLEFQLKGVTDCRFVLRVDIKSSSISAEDIQSLC